MRLLWLAVSALVACHSRGESPGASSGSAAASVPTSPDVERTLSLPSSAESEPLPLAPACPPGMLPIGGGNYWAGAAKSGGEGDEHPRHRVRVHSFCLDRTEVTTEAYEACVASGQCSSARRDTATCNSGRDRPLHPINCVTFDQAATFCKTRGARLPTELEWEYAARGGAEQRIYSWGSESPDGNTCWKRAQSCPVATHREGAFGLHDMNGNLWEWTSTWFGPYPWPASEGATKVYRGGSWSRRFEKWLSLSLRSRQRPSEFGSHLGFRCARLQERAECPYGTDGEGCRYGVEEVDCQAPETWNGVRCAPAGEVGCGEGTQETPGHGCVGPRGAVRSRHKPVTAEDEGEVRAQRDPSNDADCARYQPSRPVAWRFQGGSHAARNRAGDAKGCKNRDVGVGWNSACCP